MTEHLLDVQNLSVFYGGIHAVKSLNLHVGTGEWVALIGCNGAGKSSTLKAIAGLVPARGAVIRYKNTALEKIAAHKRPAMGMALVPEGRGVFSRMTIYENLLMGAFHRKSDPSVHADIDAMFALFPRLYERKSQLAGTLSGGEQQMLAMTRALMSKPELLLLDEPGMGLSPLMVDKVFDLIDAVSKQGTAILLVEQNANMALQRAHRAYVMDSGEIILEGLARQLLHDPKVREAYLGEDTVSACDVKASA